ncbi:hypothetical protein SAMN05421687_10993 [Salimicrobium flavidum]|uniref:Uncharacterized protein n=1 Tax=Salimicrobium flavidum TaxID=570947 RepID=A0A1N7K819_9BACI|nr:hypothetical protein SAMN05421687_10993 [Salimicrobium flavidum]
MNVTESASVKEQHMLRTLIFCMQNQKQGLENKIFCLCKGFRGYMKKNYRGE